MDDNQPDNTTPSPDRLKALQQTMAGVYAESIAVTGLPPDLLFSQVFLHASVKSLKAEGRMTSFQPGQATFIPTKDTLKTWMEDFFGDLQDAQASATAEGMAEA